MYLHDNSVYDTLGYYQPDLRQNNTITSYFTFCSCYINLNVHRDYFRSFGADQQISPLYIQ